MHATPTTHLGSLLGGGGRRKQGVAFALDVYVLCQLLHILRRPLHALTTCARARTHTHTQTRATRTRAYPKGNEHTRTPSQRAPCGARGGCASTRAPAAAGSCQSVRDGCQVFFSDSAMHPPAPTLLTGPAPRQQSTVVASLTGNRLYDI